LREQAARQVPPVYRVDKERLESSLQFLTQLRDAVTATLAVDADENAEQTPAAAWETPSRTQSLLNRLMEKGWLGVMQRLFASQEKSRILQRLANNTMAQGVVTETLDDTFFSGMTPADQVYLLDLFERRSVRALSTFLTPGQASERIASEFFQQFPGENGQAQKALGSVLAEILQPNLVFDPEATAVAREQAAAEVPTVEEFLSAGVPLLRRGEEVMPGDILKLRMHSQALQKQRAQTRTAHDTD
jgi:membrane-associated HD superfamily phosphohydrolase